MKTYFFFFFLVFIDFGFNAQNSFKCIAKDSSTKELLPGVNVVLQGTANGVSTDLDGRAVLKNIPDGRQAISFSFVGYKTINRYYVFPFPDSGKAGIILIPPEGNDLEEVIISSTRTNSRIDDLNTKVEVLGQEDMNEESTIVPGNVSSILGDLSIITVQRTNPVNGNDAIRMQGLDARYTQIMRDGFPLYGGFSGSLGVLSIPPLDLKQVEIIKGSASTLYGGGAIGGLINFISKTPEDSGETTIVSNVSSLKEYNLNVFTSKKAGRSGFTLFGGANIKSAYDVNNDGFTEVPESKNFIIHPKYFYDINKNRKLILGLTSAFDNRVGGDVTGVSAGTDTMHTFIQKEKTFRNTFDINYTDQFNDKNLITIRTAASSFQRNVDYSGFIFGGTQYSTYSEVSDFMKSGKHSLVAGLNFVSESFIKTRSDSVLFNNYNYYTFGSFIQDEWQIKEKLSIQTGLRFDHHNKYGGFFLPRISLFYKASTKWSARLACGSGYKIPNLFDFASPSTGLIDVGSSVKPERSLGVNMDINYHVYLFEKVGIQLNQAFYYTHIQDPVIFSTNTLGQKTLFNGNYLVNSYGTDTYVRLTYRKAEFYLGYNHTESLQENTSVKLNMPFNPKDKFSTTVTYTIEKKWRMGIEASYVSNQYIYNNQRVHDFWFMAGMIERKFNKGSIVLNCENLLDQRQSKFEKTVEGTLKDPIFKPVWAPLEGRIINLSLKLNL